MVGNVVSESDSIFDLVEKHWKFQSTLTHQPKRRTFQDAWSDFGNIFGSNQELMNAIDALTILKKPYSQWHKEEIDFDVSVFEALKECLKDRIVENDSDLFLLTVKNNTQHDVDDSDHAKDYAVGLVRDKVVAQCLCPSNMAGKIILAKESGSYGMSYDSKVGHAVCLLEKDPTLARSSNWNVTDCFSVVKLTTSDSTCGEFTIKSRLNNDVQLDTPALRSTHKVLGQALLYTLGAVLPCHAKRGFLTTFLPVAIIAGKKLGDESLEKVADVREKDSSKPKRMGGLRWVSASLIIPEACGDKLSYAINDFDSFYSCPETDDTSSEDALVLYIDTIASGLSIGLLVLTNIEKDTRQRAKPASGQLVQVGNEALPLKLCASPISGALAVAKNKRNELWRVAQGELFCGTLNVRQTIQSCRKRVVDFTTVAKNTPGKEKVLVKVSSLAVHVLLNNPFHAYSAIEKIRLINAALLPAATMAPVSAQVFNQEEAERMVRDHKVLLREISSVLRAVVKMDAGLVTIMADLSADYEALSLEKHPTKLSILWTGFQNLVTDVLLPMARMDIIHTDIRPGYDETSNILCRFEGQGAATTATMKLIDFDSVVNIQDWNSPDSGSYIKAENSNWTAITFLWWQCLAIAYAWKFRKRSKYFVEQNGLVQYLKNKMPESWMVKWMRFAESDNISEHIVIQTLAGLGTDLETNES